MHPGAYSFACKRATVTVEAMNMDNSKRLRLTCLLGIAVVSNGFVARAPVALACAAVDTGIAGDSVQITGESALIVWDAKNKTEHFIRRANFETDSDNIGFLVPTPGMPQLGTVDDAVFTSLDAAIEPKVESTRLTGYRFGWFLGGDRQQNPQQSTSDINPTSAPKSIPVKVMQQHKVGGYTATVLAANDVHSLERWLKKNNYRSDPALRSWLKPYVQRGWKITAFKVTNSTDSGVELKPVRLSFKTDRPFYPYKETTTARAKGNYSDDRTLKVYFVGEQRPHGTIGAKGVWPGETQWASGLPRDARTTLVRSTGLKEGQIPPTARLTVFEDTSSPRPGTDEVFFRPSQDQSNLLPERTYREDDRRVVIPIELFILGLAGTCMGALKATNRYFKKRRASSQYE
jgi:hypothetical protein